MRFTVHLTACLLLSCGLMPAADFTDLKTTGGSLGGVSNSTETRIAGGGAAFSQRLLVGISGDATASIFYGGGVPLTSTPAGTTSIGGGVIWTTGKIYSASNVLEADFLVGDNSAGRRVELGTDVSGRGQLRLRDASGNIAVNVQAGLGASFAAPVVVGVDPGGSELLRVGGGGRFQAAGNVDSTFKSTTVTGRAILGAENSGGSTVQLAAFGSSAVGTTFGVSNANAVMLYATKTGSLDPSVMGVGTFTSTPLILGSNNNERIRLHANGEVVVKGVASSSVNAGEVAIGGGRVMVGGILSAKEIKVTTTGADYVFEDGYKLRSLPEVEQFIAKEKHLPEMMSAKEMQANGMPVSEVVTKQLAKIEELTLYAIQAQKERDAAQAQAKATQEQLLAQEARLQRLEDAMRNLTRAATP